jgi:CubicO group peptidase (beta-lactamase class C family)
MEEQNVPGLAVAVARNGEVVYARGFGVRDRTTGERVDPNTVFGIASVSKSFTAMAIMQLIDSGKLTVNDPAVKLVPAFRIRGIDWMEDIQVHHLLSHTSGLPPLPGLRYAMRPTMKGYPRWDDSKPEEPPAVPDEELPDLSTFPKYIEWLAGEEVEMLGRPGEYYSYSNDGYCILASVIEHLTGRDYYEHMTENVLQAIGMSRSTYRLADLPALGNVTKLYFHNINHEVKDVPQWQDCKVYDAGGGIRSTVLDLVNCGQVYTSGGMAGDKRIVSEKGIRRMRAPVHKIRKNTYYCHGLQITPDYSGMTLVEHGGSLTGVGSAFGFVPGKGLSAAVIANVTRVASADVWLAAVNTALGLPLEQKRTEETADYDVTPDQIARFAGTYKSGEGGTFRVFAERDALKIEVTGLTFPLKASDESTLVYSMRGHNQVVRFFTGSSGKVWAAFHGGRMVRRVA